MSEFWVSVLVQMPFSAAILFVGYQWGRKDERNNKKPAPRQATTWAHFTLPPRHNGYRPVAANTEKVPERSPVPKPPAGPGGGSHRKKDERDRRTR